MHRKLTAADFRLAHGGAFRLSRPEQRQQRGRAVHDELQAV
jgi:hypothetical protein